MSQALIGLGSNLGDRRHLLTQAVERLVGTPGIERLRASTWRETCPIGGPASQPNFLNGAALIETSLSPEALLARLQEIELTLGRQRHERASPRTIDLDLLLYDNRIECSQPLELPHPRMAFRRFVLEPAAEIAPFMRHPTTGWTIAQLLEHLNTAIPYVAISGSAFHASHALASAAAAKTLWRLLEFPGAGDPSLPATSPSLSVSRAIEFLHDEAALLDRKTWPDGPSGCISS